MVVWYLVGDLGEVSESVQRLFAWLGPVGVSAAWPCSCTQHRMHTHHPFTASKFTHRYFCYFSLYRDDTCSVCNNGHQKWCKIGPRLLCWTNRKSHMHFRLVPKPSTLDDPERLICSLLQVHLLFSGVTKVIRWGSWPRYSKQGDAKCGHCGTHVFSVCRKGKAAQVAFS